MLLKHIWRGCRRFDEKPMRVGGMCQHHFWLCHALASFSRIPNSNFLTIIQHAGLLLPLKLLLLTWEKIRGLHRPLPSWCKYWPHLSFQTHSHNVQHTCICVWANNDQRLPRKWFSSLFLSVFSTLLWAAVLIIIHPPPPPPTLCYFFSSSSNLTHSVPCHDIAVYPAQRGMLISRKLL